MLDLYPNTVIVYIGTVCYGAFRTGVKRVRTPPLIPCNWFNSKCNACSRVTLSKKWLPQEDILLQLHAPCFIRVNTKRQVARFLQFLQLAAFNTACTAACDEGPKEAPSKRALNREGKNLQSLTKLPTLFPTSMRFLYEFFHTLYIPIRFNTNARLICLH